jgi:hypothetical protein
MSTTTSDTDLSTAAAERCGQCGAPAAHDQRYCLNCGFHRRNAPDPVARYLGEASVALARVAAAEALAATRRRTHRLGLRVVVLLTAFALLVGVLIGSVTAGRSSAPGSSGGRATHTQTSKSPTHAQPTKSQVKNVTGKSYVQQEQDLPNSVSP